MSTNSKAFSSVGAGKKTWQDYYDCAGKAQTNFNHGSTPFAKRQKLMSAGTDEIDPFTEDDDDFTSDDFLAMDELASQALTQVENTHHSKTPKKYEKTQQRVHSMSENAASPRVYYHYPPSPRSHSSNSFQFEQKQRKLCPVQTNIPLSIQSSSSTHGSKYLIQNKSSTNCRNATGVLEISRGTTASLTPPADQSTNIGLVEEKHVGLQELNNVKMELETTKNELKTLEHERQTKDGEIKVLRQNLSKLNAEVNKIHLEKIEREQRAKMEKTEREKELQKQLEKLRTEMQFKNQELLEAQNVCKTMELKQHRVEGMMTSPTRHTAATPPRRSPKVFNSKSPSTPGGFPTRQSFMAKDGDVEDGEKVQNMLTNSTVDKEKDETKGPALHPSFRTCPSNKTFTGNYSGPRLLGAVLEKPASSYTDNPYLNTGLISLLSPTIHKDQYLMNKEGSVSLSMRRKEAVNRCDTSLSLYSENLDLALRTVLELLNSTTEPEGMSESSLNENTAIQLLPSLEHYLTLYLDHLDKPLLDNNILTSSSMLTSASSIDARSIDRYLCHNSTSRDVSCVEENVVNALMVLQRLVGCCEAVTNRILSLQDTVDVPYIVTTDLDVSVPLISQSGTCKSTVSVRNGSAALNSGIPVLILKKIFKLVSIQQKDFQRTKLMTEALKLLVLLSAKCDKSMLTRFRPLIVEECLQNLLDIETTAENIALVLDLLTNLAANFDLAKTFCSQKDSCLLLKLYESAVLTVDGISASQITWIRSKVFVFLSSIMFGHLAGMSLLLEGDCTCSLQLVRSIILTLDNEYRKLTEDNFDVGLGFLRHGVTLLHALSFNDHLFHEHRVDVEHYYVHLVSGLSKLLKHSDSIPDQEVCILEDLWDFDQSDDNEWENEYEPQTDMEVS